MSARVSIDREGVELVLADLDKLGELEIAGALRAALEPEAEVDTSGVTWATGWYKTKRHIPQGEPHSQAFGEVRAHCSQWTFVYPEGRVVGRHRIPAANTPEVMAIDPCKICLKEARRRVTA